MNTPTKRIEYHVPEELDPHSNCKVFFSVESARALSEAVGHFTFYEYEVIPGVPGICPDEYIIIANHCGTDSGWDRELNTSLS